MIYNVVNTVAPSFLIGCSLFLQVTRTTIGSRMRSKFGQILPWIAELAALEGLKKNLLLLENCSKYFYDMLASDQMSDLCPLS